VVAANKIEIRSLLFNELQDELKKLGEPSYRAGQIADWLYQKRVKSFGDDGFVARLCAQLANQFAFGNINVVRVFGSHDTTRKFLFRLSDGNLIESVLIPASPALYGRSSDRRTICVSTQVGCAYGCKFCASGLEGFSVSAREIVDQIIVIERESGEKTTISFSWEWANRSPTSATLRTRSNH
jgi:23S rRNA (adenine2503-C2)-methyltransferase